MNSLSRLTAASLAAAILSGCASSPAPRPAAQTQVPVINNGASSQPPAQATRPVPQPPPSYSTPVSGTAAQRLVSVASRENATWYQPFISSTGGIRSMRVTEAERSKLADGMEAWQKVAQYWRESGTLSEMAAGGRAGASACQYANGEVTAGIRADCRGFVLDTPWSAAFISWVMTRASVPGFHVSPRHMDYIRAAWQGVGPYLMVNPSMSRPQVGDLLCYVRLSNQINGYEGLVAAFQLNPQLNQASHCDVVTRLDFATHTAETIGGNVANAVTLRKMQLDAEGRFILPRPAGGIATGSEEDGSDEPGCSPANEQLCSMNRQNWAALLRLRVE